MSDSPADISVEHNEQQKLTDSTVLVVDDNEQNLELLVAYLDSLECRVVTAIDGIDALEKIGQPEDHSFFIRPSFSNDEQGFDEFRISASMTTTMALVEVRFGSYQDFTLGTFRFYPASECAVARSGTDTLVFRLPTSVRQGVQLVEVRFRPVIYSHSTLFEAAVKAADYEGSWQKVDAGDATDLVDSQTTVVVALKGNAVLTDFRIEPETFTPNGDGINDVVTFRFSVNRLSTQKTVAVSIYDLSGRLVRTFLEQRSDPRGRYAIIWTGEDMTGSTVLPGLYLARVDVAAESERARETVMTRLVRVAY